MTNESFETNAAPSDGSPGVVRDFVWRQLSRQRQVGYPLPPHGHHPNFTGAAKAATLLLAHLLEAQALTLGHTVLCYPDMVLKPLRKRLLEVGIHVVVPAQHGENYRFLKSGAVNPGKASSIAGAEREGEDRIVLPEVRFVFVACVALSPVGEVLTKGYGFALPVEVLGLPSATVVHPLQLIPGLVPDAPPVTLFATPTKVFTKETLTQSKVISP